MSTPFTLAVVILLLGLAFAFGVIQSQISNLTKEVEALSGRVKAREEHGGEVDKTLAAMNTTLRKVDANVEELLGRRRTTAT